MDKVRNYRQQNQIVIKKTEIAFVFEKREICKTPSNKTPLQCGFMTLNEKSRFCDEQRPRSIHHLFVPTSLLPRSSFFFFFFENRLSKQLLNALLPDVTLPVGNNILLPNVTL